MSDKTSKPQVESDYAVHESCDHEELEPNQPPAALHPVRCAKCSKPFTSAELEQMGYQLHGSIYINVDDGSHNDNNNGNF